MTGSLIGVAAGAGYMVNAGAGLASVGKKLAIETIKYMFFAEPIPLFDHFRWEEYAIAFALGGLTNGLSSYLKDGSNALLQPAVAQLTYMGTRGESWSTGDYSDDVFEEIIIQILEKIFGKSPLR